MNKALIVVFLLQMILAFIAAAFGTRWEFTKGEQAFYLDTETNISSFKMFSQKVGTWILIFTNFVPISLMVTMELVKFW